MAISYDLTRRLLHYTVVGDVDHAVGLDVLRQGLQEAADALERGDGPARPVLFDIRRSAESRAADEIRAIATVLGGFRESLDGRCAVVVATPLYYGVSRMFSTYAEQYGIEIEIFGSPEEGTHWLLGTADGVGQPES